MRIQEGGELYGFCPAKATWDHNVKDYFNLLILSCETGTFPHDGGLLNQKSDFIENMAWFLIKWDMLKFTQKADMILGSGNPSKGTPKVGKARR